MIKNRLEKNFKKLKPWAQRNKIEAYRLYDRDIPEFPFIVDIYKDYFLVYDKSVESIDKDKNHLDLLLIALKELFSVDDKHLILKRRERQRGLAQYQKFSNDEDYFVVQESQGRFWINLYDYLDTGLFLDHRPMRYRIYKMSKNKKVLNLFCYTGSVSVFAALGGATQVHSVDLSNTYLDWAKENFELNGLGFSTDSKYFFHAADVLEWLKNCNDEFEIIFLDPPTFSNSKKMNSDFEVEKDQLFLVDQCMRLLSANGILFFSNNKRKFKLNPEISSKYNVKDITADSIPMDFHDQKIHQCFEITKK